MYPNVSGTKSFLAPSFVKLWHMAEIVCFARVIQVF